MRLCLPQILVCTYLKHSFTIWGNSELLLPLLLLSPGAPPCRHTIGRSYMILFSSFLAQNIQSIPWQTSSRLWAAVLIPNKWCCECFMPPKFVELRDLLFLHLFWIWPNITCISYIDVKNLLKLVIFVVLSSRSLKPKRLQTNNKLRLDSNVVGSESYVGNNHVPTRHAKQNWCLNVFCKNFSATLENFRSASKHSSFEGIVPTTILEAQAAPSTRTYIQKTMPTRLNHYISSREPSPTSLMSWI